MHHLLPILLCTPALALTPVQSWTSERGHGYHEVAVLTGAALQSDTVVTYRVGAAAVLREGVETIVFLPDCAATSTLLGEGSWGWDDDGWGASFRDDGVFFPDQAPPASIPTGCRWP